MLKKLFQAAVVAVVATTSLGQAAQAATGWRSQSNPLRVFENGVAQGGGYGTFEAVRNSGTVRVSNAGSLRDFRPTDNSVYHQTRYSYFTCGSTDCQAAPGGTLSSTRWNGDYWRQFTASASESLSTAYTHARGAIIVCEDQQFSPDPCSSQVVTGFDRF